jgi:hypothetical protein
MESTGGPAVPGVSVQDLYRSLGEKLVVYFPPLGSNNEAPQQYSDGDIQEISSLLELMGQSAWSRVPRIYTILRRIGQLQYLDAFTAQGITDIWFPFSAASLPGLLSSSSKTDFLRLQSSVLTDSFDLERGEDGQHRHLVDGEVLPFKILGYLGEGGFGTVDKVMNTLNGRVYARKRIYRGRLFHQAHESIKGFERELGVLKKVMHIYIVEVMSSYTDARYVAFIMSPVADGDLAAFLAQQTISASQ